MNIKQFHDCLIIIMEIPIPGKTLHETGLLSLTHWGRATHICVDKLTTIGSDNGLSPGRCQAIVWTIAGILLIGPLGTNFSEILIGIQTFSFKKMHLKMSSAKWRPSCLGLNVLNKGTYISLGNWFWSHGTYWCDRYRPSHPMTHCVRVSSCRLLFSSAPGVLW